MFAVMDPTVASYICTAKHFMIFSCSVLELKSKANSTSFARLFTDGAPDAVGCRT